jgi:predicted RNase H-like HicB family nuclease
MITRYIAAALEKAQYELIEDEEPFYGCIPGLDGVWAAGKTLEECRRHLAEALEDWVVFSLQRGAEIPEIDGASLPRFHEVA